MAPRSTALVRALTLAAGLDAACAADAGDPLKGPYDGSGLEAGVPFVGVGVDAGPGVPDEGTDLGSSATPETTIEAAASGDDADVTAQPVDGGMPEADVVIPPDGPCNLQSIPPSCPDCMTQNASDAPICQMYLKCFADQACDPATACGTNDGICGVNKIGGGEAPFTAAMTTYKCACP